MKKRKARDSLGEIAVPDDKYWDAQTERARNHFDVGEETMPFIMIKKIALIKKIAAKVHGQLRLLSNSQVRWITHAADKILTGQCNAHFPLMIWQSGSGTQTNMNVNEVIANIANQLAGQKKGAHHPVHPNDHVNMSQSSNDVFSTAMHLAAAEKLKQNLMPAVKQLRQTLHKKQKAFNNIVKVGRTHLQDAVPLTLGQEFSGYVAQLDVDLKQLEQAFLNLMALPIGGTAVGTGLNVHPKFSKFMIKYLRQATKLPLTESKNKFSLIAAHDTFVLVSGVLKILAVSLNKIANDIRWMSAGPNAGLNELILPVNEPGSSMMPGKVNPTQCEMVRMVCAQVFGNDQTVTWAGGEFELNVFKPVIIFNILQSIQLLSDACVHFSRCCVQGLKVNKMKIQQDVENNLMCVTKLVPRIGYNQAAKIAQTAHRHQISLKEACLKLAILDEEQFDLLLRS